MQLAEYTEYSQTRHFRINFHEAHILRRRAAGESTTFCIARKLDELKFVFLLCAICMRPASTLDPIPYAITKDSLPWPRLEISLKYFPCLISERGWKVLLIFIKNRCSGRLHTKSIIFNPRETVAVQQQHKKVAAQKARHFVIKM